MKSSDAIGAFEKAQLRIAHLKLGDAHELRSALQRAVAISCDTLGVTRVGVWVLSADRRSLAPLHVTGRPETHGAYAELPLGDWPTYAAAIDERRVIAADDARTDVRTKELVEGYLVPLGITALLDAPIFLGGEVWGILCHEREGAPRTWRRREIDFAVSVADMLSALFEKAARLTAEQELRRHDAAVSRREKNTALIQMGAGVAHDFGNVLQTIALLAEQASRLGPSAADAPMELIREECTRGHRMVSQLLDFARSTPRPPLPVDLGVLVHDVRTGLAALLGDAVQLDTTVEPGVLVAGNAAQLERIVTNLVVNARDAMPDGGVVRVAVRSDGAQAELSVSDQGRGIPEELRERIFEPFFTTRTAAGGTGLGLATVALIAEQHGGEIAFASNDAGTTFTLRLPALDAPPAFA